MQICIKETEIFLTTNRYKQCSIMPANGTASVRTGANQAV